MSKLTLKLVGVFVITAFLIACAESKSSGTFREQSKFVTNLGLISLECSKQKDPIMMVISDNLRKIEIKADLYVKLMDKGYMPEDMKKPLLENIFEIQTIQQESERVLQGYRQGVLKSDSDEVRKLVHNTENAATKAVPFKLPIQWRRPSAMYNSTIGRFAAHPDADGFDLSIANSEQKLFWHIQIISDDTIPLAIGQAYTIKFKAKSNNAFTLYSRLGEDDVARGNAYLDQPFVIPGDNAVHEYTVQNFRVSARNNFLYFQFGYAKPDTNCEISDIQFIAI
jgi:hypothetical protein